MQIQSTDMLKKIDSVLSKKCIKIGPGFTLIELLVVNAIISLLSSVILSTFSGVRDKARTANIIGNLEQTELAFILWMQNTGRQQWPSAFDSEFDSVESGGSVAIEDFIEVTSLSDFLSSTPEFPTGDHEYRYHRFSTDFECGSSYIFAGVNLKVYDFPQDEAERLNREVDNDGDLDCGRIRFEPRSGSEGRLYYSLSNTVAY